MADDRINTNSRCEKNCGEQRRILKLADDKLVKLTAQVDGDAIDVVKMVKQYNGIHKYTLVVIN